MIIYTARFKKHFKQRIKPHQNLTKKFEERVNFFSESRSNPILKDHPLKGERKELRSFSVTGNIRVVYLVKDINVIFIDIGSHNQVY